MGLSPALLTWIAGSALTSITVVLGQIGIMVALPVAAFWSCARRGRWRVAGAWIGLACSLKLFLAPLVVWCLLDRRRRRALLPATLAAVASAGVGAAVYGFDVYLQWFRSLNGVAWHWGISNASFHGWLARSLESSVDYMQPVFQLDPRIVGYAASAGGAVLLMTMLWRAQRMDVDQAIATIALASLWASPLGWIYYGWIAVPPMLIMWRDGRLSRALVFAGAVCLLMSPLAATIVRSPLWTLTLASSYFWGLTAFLIAAFRAMPLEQLPSPDKVSAA